MLTAAETAKRSPETGDLSLQVVLVAGARNQLAGRAEVGTACESQYGYTAAAHRVVTDSWTHGEQEERPNVCELQPWTLSL